MISMKAEKSLYQIIRSAVVDGELPGDFSLPWDAEKQNGIHFADGAADGIAICHIGDAEPDEALMALAEGAVRAASNGAFDRADELFLRLGKETHALIMIDALQSWVVGHRQELSAETLWTYTCHLIRDARDKECVKLGLSLLELFQTDKDPSVRNDVRLLGLSDEFTLFCVFIMQKWPDGNEEIWRLAQRVHGWGRLHIVERLQPVTEEIRTWLLVEGMHNNVREALLALTCWQKGNAEAVLRRGPTREEFSGIRDLLVGMLDDVPGAGISALENGDEMIRLFLRTAGRMRLDIADHEAVYRIRKHFEEDDGAGADIVRLCDGLLRSDTCGTAAAEAAGRGRGSELPFIGPVNKPTGGQE